MDDATPYGEKPCDSLLECAVFLAQMYRRPHSRSTLTLGLPLVNNRLTPQLFIQTMQQHGFNMKLSKRKLHNLPALLLPCVLILRDNQACVLHSISATHAEIILPDGHMSKKQVLLAELKQDYAGYSILVNPLHDVDERGKEFQKPANDSWFFSILWNYRYQYLQVLIAALLINLFAITSPFFVMNVYDRVVPNNAIETLWVLSLGISIIYLFDFILKLARTYIIDHYGKKADMLLSNRIFAHVLQLKMSHKPASAGAFSNNLREFESLREFFTSATLTSLVDLPFVLLFLITIGILGGSVVLVCIVAVPCILLCTLLLAVPMEKYISISMRGACQKQALSVEVLSTLETSRCLGAASQLQQQWEQAVTSTTEAGHKARFIANIASNVTYWAIQMATVAIIIIGVYRIETGLMTMGGLIACSMLSGRALAPLTQVTSLLTRYHQAKNGLHSLHQIMRLPNERIHSTQFLHPTQLNNHLEFRHINFSYPNETQQCLTDVCFSVLPGEKVGLLGYIGAGKTSILKLLMGLYQPSSGNILLDGVDSQHIDPADLRQFFAYGPQENTLFFGTIRSNITFGKPWVDDTAIIQAAKLAGVDRFVSKHPLGYNMPVAERGENLSGGQKKAIILARLFLSHAQIILLDEPTTGMDNIAERHIIESLTQFSKNKTLLLTTHKPFLLKLVDRLIIFDAGKIIADGPKDKVLYALQTQHMPAENIPVAE